MNDNLFSLYRRGQFLLNAPTQEDAEMDFKILKDALPEKYAGTHIEWTRCMFGTGARGDIVEDVIIRCHYHQHAG